MLCRGSPNSAARLTSRRKSLRRNSPFACSDLCSSWGVDSRRQDSRAYRINQLRGGEVVGNHGFWGATKDTLILLEFHLYSGCTAQWIRTESSRSPVPSPKRTGARWIGVAIGNTLLPLRWFLNAFSKVTLLRSSNWLARSAGHLDGIFSMVMPARAKTAFSRFAEFIQKT